MQYHRRHRHPRRRGRQRGRTTLMATIVRAGQREGEQRTNTLLRVQITFIPREKEREYREDSRKHRAVTVKPVSIAFRLPRSNFRVYRAKTCCASIN